MSPFLKVKEAADWLNVSIHVVYRLSKSGAIEARVHGEGQKGIRIVRASLEAYSASRALGPKRLEPSLTPFQRARQRLRSLKTENIDSLSPEPLHKGVG